MGFFPPLFNKKKNFTYRGPYPPPECYCYDSMSSKERSEFLSWYQSKIDSCEQFDFQKENLEYCQSDVHILRNACLRFRQTILSVTGSQKEHFDVAGDIVDGKLSGGIDPF